MITRGELPKEENAGQGIGGTRMEGMPKKLFSYVKGDEEPEAGVTAQECGNEEEEGAKKKLFTRIGNEEENKMAEHLKEAAQGFCNAKLEGMKQKLFTHLGSEEEREEEKKLFTHIEEVSENTIPCREDINRNYALNESECSKLIASSICNEQNAQPESPEKTKEKMSSIVTEATDDWKNFHLQLIEKIEKIYELPDGEESRIFYRFQIIIGTKTFEKTVSADDVSSFKWVKSGSQGIAFIRRGAKTMAFDEYVSNVIAGSNPSVRIVYAVNGWKKINGIPAYVYSGGTIGNIWQNVSGNAKYEFEFSAEKVGTEEVFRQSIGMLDICQDKRITLPLYLFAHMGVLTTLFNEAGFPIKFVVSVIGKTNSRKTSLALCMTKTLNRKEITKPAANFNATEAGIEKVIGLHPDAVLVIDDFMPASNKAKQNLLDTKLEKALRIYGDREGIERMTDFSKNPGAGYYPVRGIGVITGEHIRGVQSSLLRTLILQIDQKSVNNMQLTFYQKNYKILNTNLCDFIYFAAKNYAKMICFIGQRVEIYREENLFQLPRYNEMYAQLMTETEIILQYALERKFISQDGYQKIYAEWREILRQVIQQNAAELNRKDYPTLLREVCVSLAENGTSPLPKAEMKDYGDQVFEDSQIVYVRLDTFLQRLKALTQLWGIDLPGLSKKAVLDMLEAEGLIEVRSRSEGKRTLKLPGSKLNRQTYIYIKKSALGLDENNA